MDAAAIERKLREVLSPRAEVEGIAAAWLFGSVARGTARPDSDVDVGILYSQDRQQTLDEIGRAFDLQEDLQAVLKLPVQVVVLNHAPVDLIFRVLRDGRLLVERDRSRRIRFEVRSHKEYWDLEPYLRLCYRPGA
jgi:uncharacterized protein